MKGGERIRPFCGPLRIGLFAHGSSQEWSLIMFCQFISRKATLRFFVPEIHHAACPNVTESCFFRVATLYFSQIETYKAEILAEYVNLFPLH
jgi:hypothetical protein